MCGHPFCAGFEGVFRLDKRKHLIGLLAIPPMWLGLEEHLAGVIAEVVAHGFMRLNFLSVERDQVKVRATML